MTDGPVRPTARDAAVRKRVVVTRGGRAQLGQLVYWPGDNRTRTSSKKSAVVLMTTGAYVRTDLDTVELAGGDE